MSEEILSILAPESTAEVSAETAQDVGTATELENGESNTIEEKEWTLEELKAERERLLLEKEEIARQKEKIEKGFEKSISREVAKRKATEAQLEAIRLKAERTEPKREEFADDEAYYMAKAKHNTETETALSQVHGKIQEANQELLKSYDESYKALADLIPDHDTAVNALRMREGGFPQDLVDFVAQSELGPVIMTHLAKTQADWDAVKSAPPTLRAQALKALESHYSKLIEQRRTGAVKPPSKAPAPVNSNSSARPQSLDGLRGQQFAEARRAQRNMR